MPVREPSDDDLRRCSSPECDSVRRLEYAQWLTDVARERRFRRLALLHPSASVEEIREREAARRLGAEVGRMVFKDRYEYLIQ